MPNAAYIVLIPLLPLVGFVLLGLFGKKFFRKSSGIIGTGLVLVSAALAIWVAYGYFFEWGTDGASLKVLDMRWLAFSGGLSIDMNIVLQPLPVIMIVVVSFISLMVHLFSLGYMKGEPRFATYYAYLGLFTFSMLGLVLAGNLFEIYIFWELVGCSSYLLIGFYYDRPTAVAAAKKAFIVTRFADLGFLVGILILSFQGRTLDMDNLLQTLFSPAFQASGVSFLGMSVVAWGATLVFIGGAGKSALFPLHIWLPDAMEGPTPVSALIHAATMVVAGVYLVARLYLLYALNGVVPQIVLYTGAFSALLAAIIACTQTDIKRVLAYSTMSQIGYMMFALGTFRPAGTDFLGYTASIFHLFTHAFFKALLFLCAGVIIHRVHSNEMKDMGGLRKAMPLTHICFLVACLAISGIPPFSGFFSKEEILLAAWRANKFVYAMGLFTSGLTAFYMFRLYFAVFWHRPVTDGHRHPMPFFESIPLVILALGAAFAGFIPFSRFILPGAPERAGGGIGVFSIAPVGIALVGIGIAAWLYRKESDRPQRVATSMRGLYTFAYHKFYIDEVYLFVTKKIIFNLVGRPSAWIDRNIVDGLMNGMAATTARISAGIKGVQSGKVQDYTWFFFIGIAGLAVIFIYIYT
ncbi:MAG TPA: NADH-quinone oxidoreductase subunit L [Puia sp.]|jgi:NADH-quinone oxidoreductase subunit L|nr:NADH-quinone oxidoreductase subunit L [Puia sp.]